MVEVYEAKVSYWHDCWTPDATEKFPSLRILTYDTTPFHKDLLTTHCYVHSNTKQEIRDFISTCKKHSTVDSVQSVPISKNWTKLYVNSKYDKSNREWFYKTHCLDKVWYAKKGLEGGIVVAPDKKSFRSLAHHLKETGDLKILNEHTKKINEIITEYAHPYSPHLVEFYLSLSDKQKETLQLAIRNGYYEFPKKKNTKDLSKDLGVSTATITEHLVKAENKLMPMILDLLSDKNLK